MNPKISGRDCPYAYPPSSCADCCHPICKDGHEVDPVIAGCRNEYLISEWFHVKRRVAIEIISRMR